MKEEALMMLVAQVDSPLADAKLIGDRGLSRFVRVLTRLFIILYSLRDHYSHIRHNCEYL